MPFPLAAVIGGAFSAFGAKKANDRAQNQAREAMAFEAEQAEKQMGFQERMSSTAHQREVQDLLAAGLNPILSATGGSGASTPSGASGSGSSGNVQNELGAGVASAFQAQSLSNMKAQKELLQGQANQANASAELQRATATVPATIGDVVNGVKEWISKQGGRGVGGTLDQIQSGVTDALEFGSSTARKAVESTVSGAQSLNAEGVELLKRVDQLIQEANDRFIKRRDAAVDRFRGPDGGGR